MRSAITTAVLVLFITSQALAWNVAGHKIVASIAYRQLSPEERAKLAQWIAGHPRFQEDFAKPMPAEISKDEKARPEWLVQQAAIWPDMVRGFDDSLKDVYHHGTWHYFTNTMFLTDADRQGLEPGLRVNQRVVPSPDYLPQMNVVQAIRWARQQLAAKETSDKDRALYTAWLIHMIGDIHQPMHSTSLYSRGKFPFGDRGGNLISTKQEENLHAVWDNFPGHEANYREARNDALRLLGDMPMTELGKDAARDLNEKTWLEESRRLAESYVYDPQVLTHVRLMEKDPSAKDFPPLELSEDYLKAGAKVCDRRVVQAGYRLGAVLHDLLAEKPAKAEKTEK